jgi:hypothetical protein
MLFREEEAENIFTEQFCTEQTKEPVELISSLADGNASGTCVSDGREPTVSGPYGQGLISQYRGVHPMIEVLHRDEHAI